MPAERVLYPSLDAALRAWGRPLSNSDRHHVRALSAMIEDVLGRASLICVAQQGTAVDVEFGGSSLVGLYIAPGYLDVAPVAVAALGGMSAACDRYPGLHQAPGQRSAYGRLYLSGYRAAMKGERGGATQTGRCCNTVQPVGSECWQCGNEVTRGADEPLSGHAG